MIALSAEGCNDSEILVAIAAVHMLAVDSHSGDGQTVAELITVHAAEAAHAADDMDLSTGPKSTVKM